MLNIALLFLALSVVMGIMGFGGVVESGAGMVQLLFFVFFALFLILVFLARGEVARSETENVEDVTRTSFF
jgi:uncharacterized membrane protein YtjA (UPF0391 family)